MPAPRHTSGRLRTFARVGECRRLGRPATQETLALLHDPGWEKGPLRVKALQQWVQTKDDDGCPGPRERLVVIRSVEKHPRTWYVLSNAAKEIPLAAILGAHAQRQRIEELFEEGKQEVGLAHYEVRSWTGWHHHMTLTLLALWFLQLERLRLGEKKSRSDGIVASADLHQTAAAASAECT